jgi:hypothetical protein
MNTHTTYELQILQKKKETTTTHRKWKKKNMK